MAVIEPGSEEEQMLLARWIRRGRELVVGTSAMGESYLDPKIKRDEEVQELSENYVKLDHEVAEQLPHLKGRFRWDLEKYFRDHFGPYLPIE
jgi:hypothetical protein